VDPEFFQTFVVLSADEETMIFPSNEQARAIMFLAWPFNSLSTSPVAMFQVKIELAPETISFLPGRMDMLLTEAECSWNTPSHFLVVKSQIRAVWSSLYK